MRPLGRKCGSRRVEGNRERKDLAREEQILIACADWMPVDAVGGDRDLRHQIGASERDAIRREAAQRDPPHDAILECNRTLSSGRLRELEYLRGVCEGLKIPVAERDGPGKLQIEIFEKTVEHTLIDPTFVYAYPAEVSPLSRANDADPFVTDRFEFFITGRELANGFSELNDPEDQAARFQAQVARKDKGDEEAMFFDADYVRALEYGLPPTAGLGVGIDRVVMFFTDSASIRDVILFPHMRPESQ